MVLRLIEVIEFEAKFKAGINERLKGANAQADLLLAPSSGTRAAC
jgi:hypothetical protein